MSTPNSSGKKSPELLDQMFRNHHVLAPSNRQNLNPETPKQNDFNDSVISVSSSFSGDENISKLDFRDVENNPKTPLYREQYRQGQSVQQFSPALVDLNSQSSDSSTNNSPSVLTHKSKSNLYKNSVMNRIKGAANSSTPTSNEKSEDSELIIASPSKDTQIPKTNPPLSILKKSVTYLDPDISQQLVSKHPRLKSSLNSNKQLNPTKAARVVLSPSKNDIIHHHSPVFSKSSSSVRHASPLTDTLNGNSKSNFKSPYNVRHSSHSTKRKSSLNKQQDDEWIDDKDGNDDDEEDDRKKSKKKSRSKSWLSLLFSFKFKSLIDPQLPYILSLYLQLIFNVLIVSILLYFVYSFISTVKADVENKVDSYASDIIQEIALCSREYLRNNCQPGKRVVALESACSQWEKCMNQDPTTVGRAKIGAETFAEIINGFIKPISWKSMTFLFLITVGSLVLTNAAFGTYRNYSQYDAPYQHNGQSHQGPPLAQTPLHQTPFQTPYRTLQYDPAYTRFYTPKSPTSAAIVRHRSKSARKSRR